MISYTRNLSPELRRQYRYLQIYTFFRYWFLSYWIVFQPLYFKEVLNFSITQILINAALAPILSLIFQNSWSKIVDQTQNIKKYITIGNFSLIIVSTMTIYVNSFLMMLVLTIIIQVSPNGDILSNVLVYNLSDRVSDIPDDPIEKRYHNINLFARYRRFGSLGWAIGLPIGGLILNETGLWINFIICSIGLMILSIWFIIAVNEKIILSKHHSLELSPSDQVVPVEINTKKSTLLSNYSRLFRNRIYISFIIASLFYAIAFRTTLSVQGLFYNILSQNNYFELVWIYSIAALAEWPVMTILAKQVKKIGWQNVIVLSYIISGIRMAFMPFIIIFYGNIYWGYIFQIFNGIVYGMWWPTSTFGIYISLPKDQKAIGQSFYGSIELIGTFLGSLIGAIISAIVLDENLTYFCIHWIAGVVAVISGVILLISTRNYLVKEKNLNLK